MVQAVVVATISVSFSIHNGPSKHRSNGQQCVGHSQNVFGMCMCAYVCVWVYVYVYTSSTRVQAHTFLGTQGTQGTQVTQGTQ